MNLKGIIFIVLISLSLSCSTTRFVEPLEKGEIAVGANVGGPLLVFGGKTIPLPLSSIYGGYGYKENLTFYGGIHTTSLAFGNIQLDAGVRKKIVFGRSIFPDVSGAIALNGIIDLKEANTRIFPEVSINPYWNYGRWKTYLGVQAWFDFYKLNKANYGYGGVFVPSFNIGQTIDLGKWQLALEYKRLGFNANTEKSVVNYITYGGLGAQGIYLSATKTFGYKKQVESEEN